MSLLMDALKRAEREKNKVAPDESAAEENSTELKLEPNRPTDSAPLHDEGHFPSLKWTEPAPVDSVPAGTAFTAAPTPALALEERFPEPAPATETSPPPIAAIEPVFGPATDAAQPQNTAPPLQAPVRQESVVSPPAAPPSRSDTLAATKPPQAPEAATAQRQQHAAKVLAATKKTPVRNRLLTAIGMASVLLLLAGGGYLYWQYPQLLSVLSQGGSRPIPGAPTPVAATMATGAPNLLPTPPSSPAPELDTAASPRSPQDSGKPAGTLIAGETAASDTAPANTPRMRPPPAPRLAEQTPKDSAITIRRSTHRDQVAPALARGYSAFMAGDDRLAQQEYASILRQDGNNRDALLGMAAIAAKRGHSDDAIKTYLRLQELDPRDAAAQAGLLALAAGQTDPVQSESRVKILLAQQPDAHFLHFALGNLYAAQSRWAEAQQAFFTAFQKAPNNPDYLYNLAICLDHLNQGKLALEYYQRALALSQSSPARFDKAAAQSRVKELQPPTGN